MPIRWSNLDAALLSYPGPTVGAMNDDVPLRAGDTAVTAQISPCVGGLVRTWADGGEPQLWSTPDAEWLLQTQARATSAGHHVKSDGSAKPACCRSAPARS